jgi:type IV secretion system protein VirD4
VTASEQDTARPLLTPDEVMRLPAEDALVFVAGHPPIYGKRIRYYVDPVFGARAAIPPPATSDRLPQEVSPWTARASPPPASSVDGVEPLSEIAGARSSNPPGSDPDWNLA